MGLQKSDFITGAVGLLTGGPLGAVFSPLVFRGVKKVWLWALIGVVAGPLSWGVTSAIVGNKDGGTPKPANISQTESSQPNTADQQPDAIPVGTKDQVRDDRALSVSGSEVYESISSSNEFMDPIPSKGGKLVAVFLTIENTGKESGNMFWTQFQLVDSAGNKYDDIEDFTELVTLSDWMKSKGLSKPGDQLYPGAIANTAAVFRVAPNAEDLKLVVNYNKFSIN